MGLLVLTFPCIITDCLYLNPHLSPQYCLYSSSDKFLSRSPPPCLTVPSVWQLVANTDVYFYFIFF